MAKELSKVGIQTGLDIEAHHVTQSVDAFTGLDAYDVTLSGSLEVTGSTKLLGSLEVTGSISTNNTVYANALNLEGGNIQYYPSNDLLKFGDNIRLGIGQGPTTNVSDIEISSDGSEGVISSTVSNLTLQSGAGNTIIRNTNPTSNIILQPDKNGIGQSSGGVLISGSSVNVALDVRGPITGSSNISASGDIIGSTISASDDLYVGDSLTITNNITASANISASGYVVASNITSSNNISASGDIIGSTISASDDLYVGDNLTVTNDITASNNINASGYIIALSITSSGDILGSTISASDDLYVGDNLTVVNNITQQAAGSQLTLGTQGDIKTGVNYFLKTDATIQQINLNQTQDYEDTVVMYAGLNKGINIREKTTGVFVTSSLDFLNRSGDNNYGEIAMNWDATLNHGDTFYILNNVTQANGGGKIYFGNTAENFTFQMHGVGSTSLFGSNYGFKLNGNAALELGSDKAYKPSTTTWQTTSDSRLKENIITASIDTCYNNIKNLPLKYYKWKDEAQKGEIEDQHMLGWVAQDVKEVFPKAVQTGKFTTWSTYTGSEAITGSDGKTILEPGERYQDVLAGSEIIEDRHTLQSDQIIKMMYGAIQKLQEKVEALESQISGSN